MPSYRHDCDENEWERGYNDGKKITRADLATALNRLRKNATPSEKAVIDSIATQMRLTREETVTYKA